MRVLEQICNLVYQTESTKDRRIYLSEPQYEKMAREESVWFDGRGLVLGLPVRVGWGDMGNAIMIECIGDDPQEKKAREYRKTVRAWCQA